MLSMQSPLYMTLKKADNDVWNVVGKLKTT